MDLRYRRPVKSVIAHRAIEVAAREGMKVEQNAVEAIAESCGNDIRQVLNCLQMWSSKVGDSLSYKTLKDREYSIKKDEILRVSLFDATRVIVEGRRGLGANSDAATERNHLFHRNDAYFVDYNFIGLMVHQNYLKVMQPQYNDMKHRNDADGMLAMLDRVHGAAEAMSDWALCEERVRSTQSWSLLPVSAAMVLRTGSLAGGRLGGSLPGFPEFTSYLGRISTRSKKIRLLGELGFHLNYKIQGGRDELRMAYLPAFRSQFMMYLKNGDIDPAIALMDEYGLDRNDILERFDEFQFDGSLFDNLDSKTKTALTRTYNQGAHKSQALIAEQGAGPKKRKGGGSSAPAESLDPDAINEDAVAEEDDEEEIDDEADADKIRSMFQAKGKKGRGAKKAPGAKEKKPAATKAKPRKKKT
jgi:replication factor C subunit 1